MDDVAYLNSLGIDVAVTTSSATFLLPNATTQIIIKNVGTGEAFVKGGNAQTVVTASAASGMSIPPNDIENYRLYGNTNSISFTHIAVIGVAATTLRVYCVSGN